LARLRNIRLSPHLSITIYSGRYFVIPKLTLVSHTLCPYVQRAAIVMTEKTVQFARRDIDLANKPAWFLAISPLGKTPVLLVGETAIFESAVICEYLDETTAPRLHPADALARARHRSWIEFASMILNTIAGFYNAADTRTLATKRDELRRRFAQLESELGEAGSGPYFAGEDFGLVDAAFGPVFRYFDVFDRIDDFGFFSATPKLSAWRAALEARESVRQAVAPDYPLLLTAFLKARNSALSMHMTDFE
jgi:glutathione S-transferase